MEWYVATISGGYAADFTGGDSLLKKHRPEYYDLPTTNGDHCTGDGQKIAMDGVGGLLLDKNGDRFVDELQHRDYARYI